MIFLIAGRNLQLQPSWSNQNPEHIIRQVSNLTCSMKIVKTIFKYTIFSSIHAMLCYDMWCHDKWWYAMRCKLCYDMLCHVFKNTMVSEMLCFQKCHGFRNTKFSKMSWFLKCHVFKKAMLWQMLDMIWHSDIMRHVH